MKKILFGLLLFSACTTSRQSTKVITNKETSGIVSLAVMPTSFTTDSVRPFVLDSLSHTVYVTPRFINGVAMDSWPVLQAASDFVMKTVGWRLKLAVGDYYISQPWMLCWLQGNEYVTVTYDIQGACYAMNAQPGYTSNIKPMFKDAPAIVMQLNKGTRIQDLTVEGLYTFPTGLNQIQVDTLRFDEWTDGQCADNRTAPYVGIVIDPFSDPAYFGSVWPRYSRLASYYVPGMSRSGSTAVTITGCAITKFVVGILVTGGWQYNGELINVAHNRIQNVKVCYAYSQAQSKANILEDLMSWGSQHTIVDGVNYGFTHNDASTAPFIDKMNLAGWTHQILNVYASTFPLSVKRVYAEGVFRVGIVRGLAGAHFDDMQIDFPNADPGLPSPDFYYAGYATTWTGGMLRQYNTRATRIVMDFPTNTFNGVMFNMPPIAWNGSAGGATPNMNSFVNCPMYYWKLTASQVLNSSNTNVYDLRTGVSGIDTLHVDKNTFNGWLDCNTVPTGLVVNDLLVTPKQCGDQYTTITTPNYTVGYVTSVVGKRIYLYGIGVGFHDGDIVVSPIHYGLKPLQ